MSTEPRFFFAPSRLILAAAGLACAAFAPARAAQAVDAAMGPVVELPPISVTAPVKSIPWRYAKVSGYELLSHTSDATTRAFIIGQDRAQQLLRLLVPDEFLTGPTAPLTILLSNQELTPSSSRDLIPKSPARGAAARGPGPDSNGGPGALPTEGLIDLGDGRGRPRPRPIVRYISNLRIDDIDTNATYAILDDLTFDGDRLRLSPGGVEFLMALQTPRLPTWLMNGILTLYNMTAFGPDAIEFAPLSWVNADETRLLQRDDEYPRTLMALQDVLEGPAPNEDDTTDKAVLWRAEATLFARWALDGEGSPHRDAFWKYVRLVSAEPATEAVFQDCLGMSYADMRDVLSDYLKFAVKGTLRLRAAKLAKPTVPRLRDATDEEVARIKGDWQRLEVGYVKDHNPDFVAEYVAQATSTFDSAIKANMRDPGVLGVMGLYQCDIGDDAAAEPLLAAAAQGMVERPRVYFELARIQYAAARAGIPGGVGRLSAAQAGQIMQTIKGALGKNPAIAEAYLLAADVWLNSDVILTREQLGLLDTGVQHFPRDLLLIYKAAVLNLANGFKSDAGRLAEQGILASETREQRARFEGLISVQGQ